MPPPVNLDQLYQIFGDFFGQGEAAASGDTLLMVSISLVEAAHGAKRQIEFSSEGPCGDCNATGGAPGATAGPCSACGGKGLLQSSAGFVVMTQPCHRCRGKKQVWTSVCGSCRGNGRVSQTSSIEVVVPAGVADGQIVRIADKGNDYGSGPGNLNIALQVAPHPTLTRKGDDLLTVAAIDPALAHSGGELVVPWLEGQARISVPPHSRRGTVIRLAGWGAVKLGAPVMPPPTAISEGVYRGDDSHRGDLLVTLGPLPTDPTAPSGPRNIVLAATLATLATAIAAFFLSR